MMPAKTPVEIAHEVLFRFACDILNHAISALRAEYHAIDIQEWEDSTVQTATLKGIQHAITVLMHVKEESRLAYLERTSGT